MSLLSISKLSELTGRAPRTIKDRLENITPVVEGRSHLYESRDVLPLIYDIGGSESEYDLEHERARLAAEQADGKALENAKKRKNQLDVPNMVELVAGEYAFVRSNLVSMPGKVSRQLALMDDPNEIEDLLMGNISEALEELTADEPGIMEARCD